MFSSCLFRNILIDSFLSAHTEERFSHESGNFSSLPMTQTLNQLCSSLHSIDLISKLREKEENYEQTTTLPQVFSHNNLLKFIPMNYCQMTQQCNPDLLKFSKYFQFWERNLIVIVIPVSNTGVEVAQKKLEFTSSNQDTTEENSTTTKLLKTPKPRKRNFNPANFMLEERRKLLIVRN